MRKGARGTIKHVKNSPGEPEGQASNPTTISISKGSRSSGKTFKTLTSRRKPKEWPMNSSERWKKIVRGLPKSNKNNIVTTQITGKASIGINGAVKANNLNHRSSRRIG